MAKLRRGAAIRYWLAYEHPFKLAHAGPPILQRLNHRLQKSVLVRAHGKRVTLGVAERPG